MSKAITTLDSGLTVGYALLGRHGEGRGSPIQQVHDGDTVIVEAAGNLSVRFLGIDTPEVSFTLPGSTQFRTIGNAAWDAFLSAPLAGAPAEFLNALGQPLQQHLANATGPGCAANHAHHAAQAHRQLEVLVTADMAALQQDKSTFHFFMAFANEAMDGYGRLLCFLNRRQDHPTLPTPRPASYNERMLQAGLASPYFIWPNVNPFLLQPSLTKAVPAPGNLAAIATGANGLGPARQWVHQAREQAMGIFDRDNPLRLQPFELRILARREPPSRWLIDLADPGTTTLLRPASYLRVPNPEDRLFIPAAYVPLFVEAGWQREV